MPNSQIYQTQNILLREGMKETLFTYFQLLQRKAWDDQRWERMWNICVKDSNNLTLQVFFHPTAQFLKIEGTGLLCTDDMEIGLRRERGTWSHR